ncbi:MAG: UDP-2,4-diacetamido-2,4,6-trideoxy-beta-L-altropyranose hydrolase [Verrucomicrobiaceae bacterium]|nr:MAG: UDP-2,4-diacetamido-2,4,6-trideoxy-beta-L-altropyranose hydrolase [Verrucomicrobiaceae bacterium]
MNIVFRVDASEEIGTGHLMRCLTLAEELKRRGIRTRFVMRKLPDPARDILRAKGHENIVLNGKDSDSNSGDLAHSHWLGVTQEADANDTLRALGKEDWDWLMVDHYALDARWESAVRPHVKKIMVIDDLADRIHDCDLLLDQNFFTDMSSRYTGKVSEQCQLLLGPRYAMLRKEFHDMRVKAKVRESPVKRILVFFGGVDSANYTGLAVKTLSDQSQDGLQVDVVIGALHPYRKTIESECAAFGFNCHIQTERIAELMAEADLSIGSGGSSVWERCCMGLPTFAICAAENQRKQLRDAGTEGFVYTVEMEADLSAKIKRHLRTLLENPSLRYLISNNSLKAVDGRGVARVVRALDCRTINVRPARDIDSENVFAWRNHPSVKKNSPNPETITWNGHQKWLSAVLASNDKLLLIGERLNASVGVVRFDVKDKEAEVSIYLVPGLDEPGLGGELLRSAELWLAENRPDIIRIHANVLGANKHSQNFFLEHKYQKERICYVKEVR